MAKRASKSKAMIVLSGAAGAKKAGAGKGKKYCPHCGKIIGAAKTTCPECGKEIRKKKAGKKRKSKAAVSSFPFGANLPTAVIAVDHNGVDAFSAAASLIEAAGSLTQAKAMLDRLAALARLC
jgi:predicted nucleic acid-binding Zn ribbon protein